MISSLRDTTAGEGQQQAQEESQAGSERESQADSRAGSQGNSEVEQEDEEDEFGDVPEGLIEMLTQLEAAHYSSDSNQEFSEAQTYSPPVVQQQQQQQEQPQPQATPTLLKLITPPKCRDIVRPCPAAAAEPGNGDKDQSKASSVANSSASSALPAAKQHVPQSRQENHPKPPPLKRSSSSSSSTCAPIETNIPGDAPAPQLKKTCTSEEIEEKRIQAMILKKKKDAERKRELARQRELASQRQVASPQPQQHVTQAGNPGCTSAAAAAGSIGAQQTIEPRRKAENTNLSRHPSGDSKLKNVK